VNESTYNKLVESVIDLRRQQFRVQGKALKREGYDLDSAAEMLDVGPRYLVQIGVFPAPEVVDV
jgi:hypothetical protein